MISEESKRAIAEAAAAVEAARADLRDVVMDARRAGATWQDVGDVLHTTKQAAWERFR